MAVFRVEKNSNYTVMSNYHLRDTRLSLKAVGLLSKMLSLPEKWNYSVEGLVKICREKSDCIMNTIRELERAGYIERNQRRDENGCYGPIEYIIYEEPREAEMAEESPNQDKPMLEEPRSEKPYPENPDTVKPSSEKLGQLNTYQSNKDKLNTDVLNIDSFHSCVMQKPAPERSERRKVSAEEYAEYREIIRENIDYDILCYDHPARAERIDELVEIITETVCSGKKYIKVAGSELDASIVRSQFLKLKAEHILFVIDCMDKSTSEITCMKSYLITALYNSLRTINHYYDAWVNHDEAQYYQNGGDS